MKKIGICIPCYNEEGSILEIYTRINKVMSSLEYDYSILFIDNSSTDSSQNILKNICRNDDRVNVIINNKNFGPVRSAAYGFFKTKGDAVITMSCDLQDPPEMIPQFLEKWEHGEKLILARKVTSDEKKSMFFIRKLYYRIMNYFMEDNGMDQITGFGLYDREVINNMQKVYDPNPNFRFLIAEMGFNVTFIDFNQPQRLNGKSSYNFFSYLDTAINSMVVNSKKPIRLITYIGVLLLIFNFILSMILLVLSLIKSINIIYFFIALVFFAMSGLLCALAIVGEYVIETLDRLKARPLVIEKERINFEKGERNE